MGVQVNPYPLRVDRAVMEKTKFIAAENGRSFNKEVEYVLKLYIASYERAHGTIEAPEEG